MADRKRANRSERNSTRNRVAGRRRKLLCETLEDRRLLAVSPPMLDLSVVQVDSSLHDSSLIVRYRSDSEISQQTGDWGPTRTDSRRPLGFGMHEIELKSGVSFDLMLERYRRNEDVLFAEPDYRVEIATIPDDARFSELWGLHNVGQTGGVEDADIDAPEAWDLVSGAGQGPGSTVVAVIDTGVDYLHPDLAPNIWRNPGEVAGDGIDNDGNGYVDDVHGYDFFNNDGDPLDDHNHGTHVAGTIGAESNNGIGVAGVNGDVQIMAVKFLGADGSGSTSDAIAAVRYAVDNGAQISNNSWGGDPFSQAMYEAIRDARDAEHIFVAAAGNGNFFGLGVDNDATPFYPASYDLDNVVSVAATDHNEAKAIFSNYGRTSVDLGAPGVDILSTVVGGYGNSSGTSMATPHVTGALSLLRDYDSELSYQELIDRILFSADPVESLQDITVTGARLNVASSLVPDTQGPKVDSVQPTRLVLDPIASMTLSFSESIDATTFSVDTVESFAGPQGEITLSGVTPVEGSNQREFELSFAEISEPGTYQVVLPSTIEDRFGNRLDQNQNGANGEVSEDRFFYEFEIAEAVARFDFGTAQSPVATGYTRLTSGDGYQPGLGYGWQSGSVYALNRGGQPLTQDVNYTTDAVFGLDVPNGEYDVMVTLGEAIISHDDMGVFLEGVQVDSVTTAGDEFVTNTYRTTVSDGQLNLGLTDLGGTDSYVMINGLDVVFAGPDLTGPSVLSSTATGTVTAPLEQLTVVFDEPMQTNGFEPSDIVVFEGPNGPISIDSIIQSEANEFTISFSPQTTAGEYRLILGPNIPDVGGNLMDQDRDGVAGESLEDRFETLFHLEPGPIYVGRFDFGTTLSAVAPEYTRVVSGDAYDSGIGHGWRQGVVYSLNRGGDALTRDVNYTTDATFTMDVANGEYDVTLTMGELLIGHDQMAITLEGVQVDSISTAGGEFAINTYRVSVSDGQLDVGISDLGGTNAWAVINGLDVVFAGPDRTGPAVISTDADGGVSGPIDQVTVTFNEPIDEGSFDVSDVTLVGPAGTIVPLGVSPLSAGQFTVAIPTQDVPGAYQLSVGPNIEDVAGNEMDQDADGIVGEAVEDQFVVEFELELGPIVVGRFDFGTNLSPVAEDHTRITGSDGYDEQIGFGWQSGPVYSLNRGGDALTRDINYTMDGTFAVDLDNGEYDVTVTMGELLIAHDQMGVFLEGVQFDSVTTAGNEFLVATHRVTVSDGQLNLRLDDLGGSNAWAVINGLEIVFAGPDQTGPSVVSSDPEGDILGDLDDITIGFGEAIDAATFTLEDVAVLEGPGGAIIATAIVPVSESEFRIEFENQSEPGEYRVVIGPSIQDVGGNPMDQDADGTSGETLDDRFELVFQLAAGPNVIGRFDFGTNLSPVAADYTGITPADRYDSEVGYGWQSIFVYSLERGGDDMTRDINYTTLATFAVDVEPGQYDLTVTMGEMLIGHDQMGIFVEGNLVDSVTTAGGQFVVNTYRVAVTDGQLNLKLDDLGGSNAYVVINGLEIVKVD